MSLDELDSSVFVIKYCKHVQGIFYVATASARFNLTDVPECPCHGHC